MLLAPINNMAVTMEVKATGAIQINTPTRSIATQNRERIGAMRAYVHPPRPYPTQDLSVPILARSQLPKHDLDLVQMSQQRTPVSQHVRSMVG
jgi:hypothetical protein